MGDVATPRQVRARPRSDGSLVCAAGLGSLGVLTMRSTPQSHCAAKASWHGLTTCSRRRQALQVPSLHLPAWFERAEGSSSCSHIAHPQGNPTTDLGVALDRLAKSAAAAREHNHRRTLATASKQPNLAN